MENQQTYEEAVLKTVMWWSEKIQQPLNQNNGDNSEQGGMAFILMNMLADKCQSEITEDKIKIFEKSLTNQLMTFEDKQYKPILDVDYHPNEILSNAAQESGIASSVFPCKTWTRINDNNEVSVSMGYGTSVTII